MLRQCFFTFFVKCILLSAAAKEQRSCPTHRAKASLFRLFSPSTPLGPRAIRSLPAPSGPAIRNQRQSRFPAIRRPRAGSHFPKSPSPRTVGPRNAGPATKAPAIGKPDARHRAKCSSSRASIPSVGEFPTPTCPQRPPCEASPSNRAPTHCHRHRQTRTTPHRAPRPTPHARSTPCRDARPHDAKQASDKLAKIPHAMPPDDHAHPRMIHRRQSPTESAGRPMQARRQAPDQTTQVARHHSTRVSPKRFHCWRLARSHLEWHCMIVESFIASA